MPLADPLPLLNRLESLKGRFAAGDAQKAVNLLTKLKAAKFSEPRSLIRFHETVLYLRAYPQNPQVLRLSDEILFCFSERIAGLGKHDPFVLEDPEISGIAGTGLTTNFSHPFALSLAIRHPNAISLDWDSYRHPDRLGSVLARLIPNAFEDWAIAPHADWRRWYEAAQGTPRWLAGHTDPQVYDLLEVPLRWELGGSFASRSKARIPRRRIFYHSGPFLTRQDVSIDAEFRSPRIPTTRLTPAQAERILAVIIDASAVRYRELYGFLYPDLARFRHADLGRGIDIYFFGVRRKWRLPKREYCAGMYFKNGVPIGYVEVMWTDPRKAPPGGSRMEVGFNLYYTFRQGETAWLYARLLKLFGEQFKVRSFFIDPYQLGHQNDEAIKSGAFWFYRKLGFRSESPEIARLIEREEKKLAANTSYRTPPRTLRRLASARLVFDVHA